MELIFHTSEGATSPTSFSDNGVAIKLGNIISFLLLASMLNFFAPYIFNWHEFTAVEPTTFVWVGLGLNVGAMVLAICNMQYTLKKLTPHHWCDMTLLYRFMRIKTLVMVLLVVTCVLMIFGDLLLLGLLC